MVYRFFFFKTWIIKRWILKVSWVNDGLLKNQMEFEKNLYDFLGLSELKMLHQKTKTDYLLGLAGLCTIIIYFNAH